MFDSKVFDIGRPLIMAHRGELRRAPENTIPSMKVAVEAGADVLETDVQMTLDGELVLFHDDDLSRVAGRNERIGDLTLDDLRQIDFGHYFTTDEGGSYPFRGKGHSVVTVREALQELPDMRFNLDIKDLNPESPRMMASILKELNRQDSVIIASFHPIQIDRFRQLMPAVPTNAHPGEVRKFVTGLKLRLMPLFVRSAAYRSFAVPIELGGVTVVTPRFVRAAQNRNIAVHVWTINDRPTMEWLIDLGVDGIFTDEPALMRSLLSERGIL
ncbi:MAG: glycerophosphodiester phosphodiesterase [Promethearchaeota archaeon]